MFCQKCGKTLDDEAIMCPACGSPTINAGRRPVGKNKRPLSAEEAEALAAQEKAKKRRTTLLIAVPITALIVLNWIIKLIEFLMN